MADPTLSDKEVAAFGYAKFENVSEEELEFKMCFFIPPEYANKVVGFLMVWTCFTGCYDLWAQSTIKWEGEQHYRESTIGMFAFSWAITICIPRIIAVYFYG